MFRSSLAQELPLGPAGAFQGLQAQKRLFLNGVRHTSGKRVLLLITRCYLRSACPGSKRCVVAMRRHTDFVLLPPSKPHWLFELFLPPAPKCPLLHAPAPSRRCSHSSAHLAPGLTAFQAALQKVDSAPPLSNSCFVDLQGTDAHQWCLRYVN